VAVERKVIITGSLIVADKGQAAEQAAQSSQTLLSGQTPYFNRLIWMLPNGEYGYYDKRHLFAYAEEDKYYSAGAKRLIASVKGWRINLLVCYDLRFPVWARQTPLSSGRADGGETEYDVLIYVANWPERRIHAWKTLLQARAIENQCYAVGVNRVGDDGNNIHYSGESMIVDPLGEILYTNKDEEDIHTITLDKAHLMAVREKLPFLKDADDFMILKEE